LGCNVALIKYTLGPGNPRGVGILEGRVQGANGGQRELVYEQPGTEVDEFLSQLGGFQVSRREYKEEEGENQQGERAMYNVYCNSCQCIYWTD
jgi:hypothetical protein